jgi:hypothetical protein
LRARIAFDATRILSIDPFHGQACAGGHVDVEHHRIEDGVSAVR